MKKHTLRPSAFKICEAWMKLFIRQTAIDISIIVVTLLHMATISVYIWVSGDDQSEVLSNKDKRNFSPLVILHAELPADRSLCHKKERNNLVGEGRLFHRVFSFVTALIGKGAKFIRSLVFSFGDFLFCLCVKPVYNPCIQWLFRLCRPNIVTQSVVIPPWWLV